MHIPEYGYLHNRDFICGKKFVALQILTIEEDKVFDFKYVRHSPKLYTQSDLGPNKDDVKSDGSLRLHIGRIHVVLLYKLLVNLQVSG